MSWNCLQIGRDTDIQRKTSKYIWYIQNLTIYYLTSHSSICPATQETREFCSIPLFTVIVYGWCFHLQMSVVRCALQRSKGLWNSLSTRAVWILQKNIMGIFSGTPPHRDDSPALSLNLTLVFVPYYPYKVALGGYPYGSWRTYPFAGFLDFIFFWLLSSCGWFLLGGPWKSAKLLKASNFRVDHDSIAMPRGWTTGFFTIPKSPKRSRFFVAECSKPVFLRENFSQKVFAREGHSVTRCFW